MIATVRTPSGGLHFYFTGSQQRTGHLPACHIDFLSQGGYVLAPPSQIGGTPYQHVTPLAAGGELDWQAAIRALETSRAADLSPLAAAARQAGLTEPEITATLDSARRTAQAHPEPNGREAEGAS